MNTVAAIIAQLSSTQRAALMHAQEQTSGRMVLHRGKLDLEYATVPVSTLGALARLGLADVKTSRVERRSKRGVHYKGMATVTSHGVLTETGRAVRAALQQENGS